MAATALIRFVQSILVGPNGQALIGTIGVTVTVENSDNTDVAEWLIELLYVEPNSILGPIPPGTPVILGQAINNTPSATFDPDVSGSYRVRLTVWDALGTPNVDIRVFSVPLPGHGIILPPYQKRPDPLPLPGSGNPAAKPEEMNFDDQPYGWCGDDSHQLLNQTLIRLDGIAPVPIPGGGDDYKLVYALSGSLAYADFIKIRSTGTGIEFDDDTIIGINQNSTPGHGYDLIISGSNAGALNFNGGDITVKSGEGDYGGDVIIEAGESIANGPGCLYLRGGLPRSGSTQISPYGDVYIQTQTPEVGTTGRPADIYIETGECTGVLGGDITLRTGICLGGAGTGSIYLQIGQSGGGSEGGIFLTIPDGLSGAGNLGINLTSGNSSGSAGSGIILKTSDSLWSGGQGSAPVNITTGSCTLAGPTGTGAIYLNTGDSLGATATGNISLICGNAGGNGLGGSIVVSAGDSVSGVAGDITLNAGAGSSPGTMYFRVNAAEAARLYNSSGSHYLDLSAPPSGSISFIRANKNLSIRTIDDPTATYPILVMSGSSSSGTSGALQLYTGNADSASGGVSVLTGASVTSGSGWITMSTGSGTTSGQIHLTTGSITTGDSGAINIATGAVTTGTAGSVSVTAANSINGAGGSVTVRSGDSASASTAVTIRAGSTTIGGAGGSVFLYSGNGIAGGGNVNITGGDCSSSDGYGGFIYLFGGAGEGSSYGGNIQLQAGRMASGDGAGGNVLVTAGDAYSLGNGDGGDITLTAGLGYGTGSSGIISFNSNSDTILIINNSGINANSHLISDVTDPVDLQDAATKNYVDNYSWDAEQIIYLAKYGDDIYNGDNPSFAVLTLGRAIELAISLSPDSDNKVVIYCEDTGEYDIPSVTIPEYVNLYAPVATFICSGNSLDLGDNTYANIGTVIGDTDFTVQIFQNSSLVARNIVGGSDQGIGVEGSGISVDVDKITMQTGSGLSLIDDDTSLHFNFGTIHLTGLNSDGIDINYSGQVVGSIGRILGRNSGEQQRLDQGSGTDLGCSVAIEGNTIAVGADIYNSNTGCVFIWERSGGEWILQETLVASDGSLSDWLGISCDIDNDTVIAGADYASPEGISHAGAAYVFVRSGGIWSEQGKLVASDAAANDWFGHRVAISGDWAIVGAPKDDDSFNNSGSVYVFHRDGSGVWSQTQKLNASDPGGGDLFGHDVTIDGAIALIGAQYNTTGSIVGGSVYVFERDEFDVWTQVQKLTASDAASYVSFGYSICLDGTQAIISSHGHAPSQSGAVYIFEQDEYGVWSEQQILTASDAAVNDWFGYSVSISGNNVAIGAPYTDDEGTNSGSFYSFIKESGTWTESTKWYSSFSGLNRLFGNAVAVDGNIFVIGEPNANAAYIFADENFGTGIIVQNPNANVTVNVGTIDVRVPYEISDGTLRMFVGQYENEPVITGGTVYVRTPTDGLSEIIEANNSAGDYRIIDLADPVDAQDAATKNYVDGYISTVLPTIGQAYQIAYANSTEDNLNYAASVKINSGETGIEFGTASIIGASGDLIHNVITSQAHIFKVNSVEVVRIDDQGTSPRILLAPDGQLAATYSSTAYNLVKMDSNSPIYSSFDLNTYYRGKDIYIEAAETRSVAISVAASSASGGDISISAGGSTGSSPNEAGNVSINAGGVTGTATPGDVILRLGADEALRLIGSDQGLFQFYKDLTKVELLHQDRSTDGHGADFTISAQNAYSATGDYDGGDIIVNSGAKTGTGTNGEIQLATGGSTRVAIWDNYLELKNASSAPGTPSLAGRVSVQDGVLKYIGSDGTVTDLAIA